MKQSDLHLTGMVSMFVASKYEDVFPLTMKKLVTKIGHNKFTMKQIVEKELEILQAVSFDVGFPTIL